MAITLIVATTSVVVQEGTTPSQTQVVGSVALRRPLGSSAPSESVVKSTGTKCKAGVVGTR